MRGYTVLHTEDKKDSYRKNAKVVAAAWETELLQFLAALAIGTG